VCHYHALSRQTNLIHQFSERSFDKLPRQRGTSRFDERLFWWSSRAPKEAVMATFPTFRITRIRWSEVHVRNQFTEHDTMTVHDQRVAA
jgi:hypothetical protein